MSRRAALRAAVEAADRQPEPVKKPKKVVLPAVHYDNLRYIERVEMMINNYMREINAREGRQAIDFLDARSALLGCVAL